AISVLRLPPPAPLFPYTTLFRSHPRVPSGTGRVLDGRGGDHLSGGIRQAQDGGVVAEVDADEARRPRVDAEHLRGPAPAAGGALRGDGDDALIEQATEDIRDGRAGEPQRLGDLPSGELPAAMQQRQHVCTVLVPDAPLPVHAGER